VFLIQLDIAGLTWALAESVNSKATGVKILVIFFFILFLFGWIANAE
jgi:hypothetical protein